MCIIAMKIVLTVPRTLHSMLATVCFGLAIGSRKDLSSVGITQHVNPYPANVEYSVSS